MKEAVSSSSSSSLSQLSFSLSSWFGCCVVVVHIAGWLLMTMMVMMVVFIFVIRLNWCRWEENSRCQKATIILSKVRCFRNGQWPKTVHLHKSFSFKLWSVYQSIPYSLPTYILYRVYIYISGLSTRLYFHREFSNVNVLSFVYLENPNCHFMHPTMGMWVCGCFQVCSR